MNKKKIIKLANNNNKQEVFKENFKKELDNRKISKDSFDYRLFNLMVSKNSLKYIGDDI